MLKIPKKQSEIMIVGSGDLPVAVASYLAKKGRKVTRIDSTSSVHFLGTGLLSNGVEKVGFKRALVVLPSLTDLPEIKGLLAASYRLLPLHGPIGKNLRYIVAGSGPEAVDAAMSIARNGSRVDIVHEGVLLAGYDVSIQDAVRRHLKKLRIGEVTGYSILACMTKNSKTSLLLKNKDGSKQLVCDRLLIEPVTKTHSDIGLTNLNLSVTSTLRKVHNGVLLVEEQEVFDLTDIKRLASILDTNRGTLKDVVPSAHCKIQDAQLFSFGILEQDVAHTHHAYQRSIVRINEKLESFNGFLKVLASKHGNILAISGILPVSYQNVALLRYAVKHRSTVEVLMGMLDVGDQLTDELMEVAREIG